MEQVRRNGIKGIIDSADIIIGDVQNLITSIDLFPSHQWGRYRCIRVHMGTGGLCTVLYTPNIYHRINYLLCDKYARLLHGVHIRWATPC